MVEYWGQQGAPPARITFSEGDVKCAIALQTPVADGLSPATELSLEDQAGFLAVATGFCAAGHPDGGLIFLCHQYPAPWAVSLTIPTRFCVYCSASYTRPGLRRV